MEEDTEEFEDILDTAKEDKDDFLPLLDPEPSKESKTDLTDFIAECVHYNVSDRGAAALYNAAMRTREYLSETTIFDKSKIKRGKDKLAVMEIKKKTDNIHNSG